MELDYHWLVVRFPRGGIDVVFEAAGNDVMALLPRSSQRPHAVVSITLKEGAQVSVDGYGWVFYNALEPEMEKWVNENAEIFPGVSLQAFLNGDAFTFVVPDSVDIAAKMLNEAFLLEPFEYPYGEEHSYDISRYTDLLDRMKSKERFMPAP